MSFNCGQLLAPQNHFDVKEAFLSPPRGLRCGGGGGITEMDHSRRKYSFFTFLKSLILILF